jgi:hypothetical protein
MSKLSKPSKSNPPSMYMSDPILSPDGKWIWTGAEWITAPPASTQPNDVSIQETVSMSKKEKPIKSSINTHKRKFAYVSIVFVILIAVYLLMNSSPEYESQDYWNSQGIGYRFTGDDVYVLVDPIEEQECESLLDDSNWTLIEENGNFCVFDSILTSDNSFPVLLHRFEPTQRRATTIYATSWWDFVKSSGSDQLGDKNVVVYCLSHVAYFMSPIA